MKNIINKVCVFLISIILVIPFFNTHVYADSTLVIDGVSYTVDSFTKDASGKIIDIVKNGIRYLGTSWASSSIDSNNLWAKSVASGIITVSALETMKTAWDLSDMVGNFYDSSKQWVLDGWNKAIDNTKNNTLDIPGKWLIKRLLGASQGLADTYSSIKDAVLDTSYTVESSYRNYYSNAIDNVYNRGATDYYTVYNDNTKQFYNTYNNTYEYVTNYNYDIYNDYYTYYTTNNYYQVTNNYNYTFVNTGTYAYSLYYALPDGTNSYNLTEEEIKGIRTDFNVSNYETSSSSDGILGLYHLNGSIDSFVSNNYLDLSNSVLSDGLNFVDSYSGFDLALIKTSLNKLTNIRINNSSSTYNLLSFNDLDSINNIRFMLYLDKPNTLGFGTTGLTYDIIRSTISLSSGWSFIELNRNINNTFDVYVNGVLSLSDINLASINYRDFYPSTSQSYYDFCIGILGGSNFSYLLLDELFISNKSFDNHDIGYLPFDSGVVYTLPKTDTNNKLLIKSNIPVNSFQFGGVRSSFVDSTKGDVYVYLDDNYKIKSIQQFNGSTWVSVDGAIYNDIIGKWVSAIGFSVLTGDWSYTDLTANDVDDIKSLAQWLDGVFTGFIDSISNIFDNIFDRDIDLSDSKEKIGDDILINNGETEEKVPNDLDDYMLELKDLSDDIVVPNIENDLGDDLEDIQELTNISTGILDPLFDNGLGIGVIAVLILTVLRLVI